MHVYRERVIEPVNGCMNGCIDEWIDGFIPPGGISPA